MKIAILTSSRADFGVYLPLLRTLSREEDIEWGLVVFGTHLSKIHGYTINQIEQERFPILHKIESLLIGDSSNSIANSYALTTAKFADFWNEQGVKYDLVFALGDRFEMAAAVSAAIPFGVRIAHISGGEITEGAIDNIYRHFISLASTLHFVSAAAFEARLKELLDDKQARIYNVGALSLENLEQIELLTIDEFYKKWHIDLSKPTLLVTVHPETVAYQKNDDYCKEISAALKTLAASFQVVITMPNADTSGLIYRSAFTQLAEDIPSIYTIENFGTQSYFTCMKYAKLLVGNTSSGIVEAASFNKYVLNLGDRQKGRLCGENVIHLPFIEELIVKNAHEYASKVYLGGNLYQQSQPSANILTHIRSFLGKL